MSKNILAIRLGYVESLSHSVTFFVNRNQMFDDRETMLKDFASGLKAWALALVDERVADNPKYQYDEDDKEQLFDAYFLQVLEQTMIGTIDSTSALFPDDDTQCGSTLPDVMGGWDVMYDLPPPDDVEYIIFGDGPPIIDGKRICNIETLFRYLCE